MEKASDITINELTFTHFLEMGQILIAKGGVPREIVETTLKRIALENELSPIFLC